MGHADPQAVSAVLDGKPLFFGERPATGDTLAYGCLASLLLVPVETELKRLGEGFANVRPWCEAIEACLFGGSA
ncbi:MAG TPA: glutathione S-transferase C-terminal domain-containing protein [Geminicoccaceae bacterium]|nr:glutathione S-transferase C-terminal domain-containing protein [Geminicoccaceae bacterium]